MKTTGEKIRESRTHLGLTQTELADKIGVTLRTITKYEKQGVMPRGVSSEVGRGAGCFHGISKQR